jgi:hypothetical protein
MKLLGQRWVFQIGNSVVCIDNAFAWIGWAQERMVINDEIVQSTDGWFRLRQDYLEPWIVPGGEGLLTVKMVARMMDVACSADLDGQPLVPVQMLKAKWSGPKRSWPEEAEWAPAKQAR